MAKTKRRSCSGSPAPPSISSLSSTRCSPEKEENQTQTPQVPSSSNTSKSESEHETDSSPNNDIEEGGISASVKRASEAKTPEDTEKQENQQGSKHTSPERNENTKVDSGRITEFEDAASGGRKASREASNESRDGVVDDQCLEPESKYHTSQQATPTSNEATHVIQSDVNQEEPPHNLPKPISEAPWVRDALSAAKANPKNPFKKGEVLIVLDRKDLAKSILVQTLNLRHISDSFNNLCSVSELESPHGSSESGLKAVLVLDGKNPIPDLLATPLDEDLSPPEAEEESATSKPSRRITRTKRESSADTQPSQVDVTSKPDWPKAYDSLFRIALGKRGHGLPERDAELALPRIEDLIAVAKRYQALGKIRNIFDRLFLEYIQHCTLFKAIEQAPTRWMNIAIALEHRLIYDEAFKHLVGRSANHAAGFQYHNLPEKVQKIISDKAHTLHDERMLVERKLMLLTLPSLDTSSQKAPSQQKPSQFISQHNRPTEYSTRNIFTDWLKAHMTYLDDEEAEIPELDGVCNHELGCRTVAGFYRVVYTGGNSYLPCDVVCEEWNVRFTKHSDAKVKGALEALKMAASGIAAALVASELQLAGKDRLDYLTCVKLGSADVPWDEECKDEDDDDMDVDAD